MQVLIRVDKRTKENVSLKEFLDRKVLEYNRPEFVEKDPICIPHGFTKAQDIEISAFFAAIFAWGNRTTIIRKCKELMAMMDHSPYEFITKSPDKEFKKLLGFKHRTFSDTDLLYFVEFLKHHYAQFSSLEDAFMNSNANNNRLNIESSLIAFHEYFFSLEDAPARTKKHISTPYKNSACKRLNMFLRWMVRNDGRGVDFGLWKRISPADLICPLDLHVARVARRFNLVSRAKSDWLSAVELTKNLRKFDKADPVKYDFALFGLGLLEKF